MKRPVTGRDSFTHFTAVQSVWGDMDALGHVNNVLYFRYGETARLDYMNRLAELVPGLAESMWDDSGMILAEVGCRFLKQLHAPTTLQVGTRVAKIGNKTLHYECALYDGDSQDASAIVDAVVVWFDYQAQKAIPVPEAVREGILQLESTAPDLA